MSHNLERLLIRVNTRPRIVDMRSEFSHNTIEHALSRGLITHGTDDDLELTYCLTEQGRSAIAA